MPAKESNMLPIPTDCTDIILDYASDTPWAFNRSMLFSRKDWTLKQILYLAEHAGPLEQFDALVRQLINHELEHKAEKHVLIENVFTLGDRKGTLIECLVTGLDKTIKERGRLMGNPKNPEKDIVIPERLINEGMSERFITIVTELLSHKPKLVQTVLTQAKRAAPIESKDDQEERVSNNRAALNILLDSFKKDDKENQQKAIDTFREYVEKTKRFSTDETSINPTKLINNLYYKNLIKLIGQAFFFFCDPQDDIWNHDKDETIRVLFARVCFEIIGPILQANLPPHTIQLLEYGLEKLFRKTAPTDNDLRQIRPHVELDSHCYFDHDGFVKDEVKYLRDFEYYAVWGNGCFGEYLDQLNKHYDHVSPSMLKNCCVLM
jgi:hypothetical protein